MKKILLGLSLLLFATSSYGASIFKRELHGDSAFGRVEITTTTTGSSVCSSDEKEKDISLYLDADAVSGTTPTLDAKVQYSSDGSTWEDWYSFTQVTTSDDHQVIHVPSLSSYKQRCLRAKITIGGTTPVYNVLVYYTYGRL